MEQTEMPGLKLVDKESCCGGTTCDEAAQKAADAASAAPLVEMTKEALIANVLELSMTVNRLNTEIGSMAKGMQQMVAEMYQGFMGEIEAIKKSITQ